MKKSVKQRNKHGAAKQRQKCGKGCGKRKRKRFGLPKLLHPHHGMCGTHSIIQGSSLQKIRKPRFKFKISNYKKASKTFPVLHGKERDSRADPALRITLALSNTALGE